VAAAKMTLPRQFLSYPGKIFAINAVDMEPMLIAQIETPQNI